MRKPFFKKSHRAWYFQDDSGKQVRLGTDKAEAFREYHRLMAGELPVTSRTTVVELLDQFLGWVKDNRAPTTYEWYRQFCSRFAGFVGSKMRVAELRALHITKWIDSFEGSNSYKNGAVRAISRSMNWARKQGLIAINPIQGMERPAAEPREDYLTLAQWDELLTHVKPGDFHDLICFMWETGVRPYEARTVEASHLVDGRLILERCNSKGKKSRRVIRLNDRARAIVDRRIATQGEGPIFRTRYGRGWSARALQDRFQNLSSRLGYRVIAYSLRHSWVTHALLRGVDPVTVGILAGHKDATMVMRVYNHLAQDEEFLNEKLRQATALSA